MSHLRPEDRSRNSCRKGRHYFGANQHIGGGIARRICEDCGEITIDLTGAEEVTTPIDPKRRSGIGTIGS